MALFAMSAVACAHHAVMQPVVAPAPHHTAVAPVTADMETDYRLALERHVDAMGRVDYATWSESKEDRRALERYTGALLAALDPSELADWLNLYNALVTREIVRRWPMESVQDLDGRDVRTVGGAPALFYDLQFDVAGDQLSLLDIETQIIRLRFADPRALFAISCGTRSCPLLPRVPYSRQALDRELEQATRAFVNHPDNVSVSDERREVALAAMLGWYAADLRQHVARRSTHPAPTLYDFLAMYAEGSLARAVSRARDAGYALAIQPYDWRVRRLEPPPERDPPASRDVLGDLGPMPDVTFATLDGEAWRPSDARGQVLLIEVWASWCRPCLRSFPRHGELLLAHEASGLRVIAVAQDQRRAPVEAFVAANRVAFDVLLDAEQQVAEAPLSVVTLPTLLLVDRKGIIRHRHEGYDERLMDRVAEEIEVLLAEPAP